MAEVGIVSRFNQLVKEIADVSKQFGKTVPRLVAVSKLKPASDIQCIYDLNHRHFGENYVQELMEKSDILPKDIKWHLIGHLQSQKCNALIKKVPGLWCVESVDSEKLADKLNSACVNAERQTPLNVFVQVHTSDEETKTGCLPSETIDIVRHICVSCPHLHFMGLMTIGKLEAEPTPYFRMLVDLKNKVKTELSEYIKEDIELSMGMSGDWKTAIEEGSTNIRVGSTIFGARNYTH
ncbi:hypothetical protein WA158_000188 [Blastocystis sp. Blastoise]